MKTLEVLNKKAHENHVNAVDFVSDILKARGFDDASKIFSIGGDEYRTIFVNASKKVCILVNTTAGETEYELSLIVSRAMRVVNTRLASDFKSDSFIISNNSKSDENKLLSSVKALLLPSTSTEVKSTSPSFVKPPVVSVGPGGCRVINYNQLEVNKTYGDLDKFRVEG